MVYKIDENPAVESLQVGDLIETEATPLCGLSNDGLVLEVRKVFRVRTGVSLWGTYLGVYVGCWDVTIEEGGELLWSKED